MYNTDNTVGDLVISARDLVRYYGYLLRYGDTHWHSGIISYPNDKIALENIIKIKILYNIYLNLYY